MIETLIIAGFALFCACLALAPGRAGTYRPKAGPLLPPHIRRPPANNA